VWTRCCGRLRTHESACLAGAGARRSQRAGQGPAQGPLVTQEMKQHSAAIPKHGAWQ
jgi:hypothetical protein